jgi:hypothetical protein
MINNAQVESNARSARSAPSALSSDSLSFGSEQEVTEEEGRNMMYIGMVVNPQIDASKSGLESNREAYDEEHDSR